MSLDIRTLYMVAGASCFLVAGAFLFFQSRQFRKDGVREWSMGYAFQGTYWLLLGLRGLIPDFLSIIVANTFLTAGYSLLYVSVRAFQYRAYRRDLLFLPTIVTFIFISFFSAYVDNFFLRTIYISLLSAIQMGSVATILFRERPFHLSRSQWLTGCFFAVGAVLWFIRFLERVIYQTQFLGPSIVLTALLLMGSAVVVLTNLGFLLMIRERVGEELKESENRYHSLFSGMTEGFALHDIILDEKGKPCDYRFLDINPAFEKYTGLKREDVVGKLMSDVLPGEDRYWTDIYGEVALTGKPVHFEHYSPVLRRHYEVFSYRPNPLQFAVVFTDVTERKKTEEALRKSEEQYRHLVQHAPAGIFDVDFTTGYFTEVNDAMCQILGYTRNELLAMTAFDILDNEGKTHFASRIGLGKSGQQPDESVEYRVRTRDGRLIWAQLNVTFRWDGTTIAGATVVAHDITQRKQAEQSLAQQAAKLAEINKELESFNYSVSHDLRAPLRAIDGFSRMILKRQGESFDEDSKRQFQVIRDNVKSMGNLIDDLLAFSRLGRQEVTMVNVDMDELIREAWEEMVTIDPDRSMILNMEPIPALRGDRTLIRQVYGNLLGNAVKFTNTRETAVIEVGSFTKDNERVYFVRDNGVGFDMKHYSKLFGVFQRLHSDAEYVGTGIGLALVQRSVERHGGRVWAQAEVDKGATFYFTLAAMSG
jgi:PAS domain S-box-containing protein